MLHNLSNLSSENRHYLLQHLPTHFADLRARDGLKQVLTCFAFLQAKLNESGHSH